MTGFDLGPHWAKYAPENTYDPYVVILKNECCKQRLRIVHKDARGAKQCVQGLL